jgi:hypothetical protein
MFWSRESATVNGMYRCFEQSLTASVHLGLMPQLLRRKKKWPIDDQVGFGEAMLILWQSLQKGKHVAQYQQFDSVRKIRSLAANMQYARAEGNQDGIGFKDGGKALGLVKCSTNSTLFSMFIKGCEKRMGRVIKQDVALSVDILLALLTSLEETCQEHPKETQEYRKSVLLGACLVIGFCSALRGNEILLVESSALCKFKDVGKNHVTPHVIVPLMGRFKGETGERNVLRPLVNVTQSGIPIRHWVERLIEVLVHDGRDNASEPGPAFCDEKGLALSYGYMNQLFHEELERVQQVYPDLIGPDVTVCDVYNLYRSLRRGATSRANVLNYTDTVINTNNRWRTTQSNKGKGGLTKMSQLYVEVSMIVGTLLEFSASL